MHIPATNLLFFVVTVIASCASAQAQKGATSRPDGGSVVPVTGPDLLWKRDTGG